MASVMASLSVCAGHGLYLSGADVYVYHVDCRGSEIESSVTETIHPHMLTWPSPD